VHFRVEGARAAVTEETKELAWDASAGETEETTDRASDAVLVGRLDAHAQIRESEPVELVVDTRSLHFFDPETGLGIYDTAATKGAGE
jgi:multiple sugar transport system ATP-binding protein